VAVVVVERLVGPLVERLVENRAEQRVAEPRVVGHLVAGVAQCLAWLALGPA